MEHDAWFFVGIFAFIFVIWIATGGPLRPLSFAGPRLSLPSPLDGGTYLSFPRAPFGVGASNVSLPGSSGGGGALGGSDSPLPTFTGGIGFGEPSPYRGLVSMSHYVSGAGSPDPKNEYVELRIAQNAGTPITISGWTFSSDATGKASIIPKGTEVPSSGVINATQDIVLRPGERALVSSGQSPIGASFRENKCIGYFGTFQNFYPQLPQNCPVPSDELASFYGASYLRDAACIDYVKPLPRCQIAISPPAGASNACQNFLTKYLHYNGCMDAHRNDADFNGNTWRIYLGRTSSMWRPRHELVKLLDAQGKTVDAFSY